MKDVDALRALDRLLGSWTTEATHPALPGVVVHGSVEVEWLEGERFLIHRARTDHPQFPDSISIIGFTDRDRADRDARDGAADDRGSQLKMHYFDSRGVFRAYGTSVDQRAWRFWLDAPGFGQRFTGTYADDGNTVIGLCEMLADDGQWHDDLRITYRRA